MNRVYVAMDIKAVDADARRIEGWASTASVDRVGDVVVPGGAIYELPIPFLLDHDPRKAVGEVDRVEVTAKGIKFWAHIKKIAEPGEVKDLCDAAWSLVKNGLRKAVSIGFRPLDGEPLPAGGFKFTSWEWFELSAVVVPAQADARITSFKSLTPGQNVFTVSLPDPPNPNDRKPAASGKTFATVRLVPTPPASGKSNSKTPQEGKNVKISEKILAYEAKRAANMARIKELHESTDGSLDDSQREEIANLKAEVATIDSELPDLKMIEADQAKAAKPVARTVGIGDNGGPVLQATPGISVKLPEKPEKGIQFARYARCLALSHKTHRDVVSVASELYGERDPDVVAMVKAAGTAVGALNTTTDASLIGNIGGFADFVEFLRAMTIVGKFGTNGYPSLRRIPFRVPIITQPTGSDAWWVGEGDGKPLTKPSFGRTTLAPLKVATICVATMEVLRDSSPSAERLIRDDLAAAVAERIDISFIGTTGAGNVSVSGVSPASITYGAETIGSTGPDADDIRLDVRSAMQKFIDAKNPLSSGVWVMSSSSALALSMMQNPLGQAEFPTITMNGGTFMGLPVITSEYVGDFIVLMNASDVWFADDGGVQIDMSTEASLQMVGGDDQGATMNSITPTATSVVSMFQTNSVAFRAERTLDWALRRASAVVVITDVAYGGAVVPS